MQSRRDFLELLGGAIVCNHRDALSKFNIVFQAAATGPLYIYIYAHAPMSC